MTSLLLEPDYRIPLTVDGFAWFSDAEREQYRPAERIEPREWANRYRVLDEASVESGSYDWRRTPYIGEPLDAIADRTCGQVTFIKSTQVGGTELLRNHVGYAADQDPGPILFVVPRKEDCAPYSEETLQPVFECSPRLRRLFTGRKRDRQKKRIRLRRCSIYIGAAQSAVDLSRRPIRYLFGDECDKWPERAGKEAAPFGLARERLRTYESAGLAKIVLNSTPTTREGLIHKEWLKSDQRKFHVPCPHCDHFQVLRWEQIQFPKDVRDPEEYLADPTLAQYLCEKCEQPIPDSAKQDMLERGHWVPKGCTLLPDGSLLGPDGIGEYIPRSHRGYHVWAAYSPWITWARIVAEWCRCLAEDDLQNFVNSWLGELWEEKVEEPTREKIERCVAPYARDEVPDGVVVMTAGVDVQKVHLKYVIHGWGAREESWLIRSGRTNDWNELERLLFEECWGERGLKIRKTCIDYRHRTDEVLACVRRFPDLANPIIGVDSDHAVLGLTPRKLDKDPKTGASYKRSIIAWNCPVAPFKDKLAAHIDVGNQPGEYRAFHVHEDPQPDYVREMSSEQKILARARGAQRRARTLWVKKPGHRQNDFWAATVYAFAAAHLEYVPMIGHGSRGKSTRDRLEDQQKAANRARRRKKGGGWLRNY